MPATTITKREFDQGFPSSNAPPRNDPVIVTDESKPTFVVMKFEDYQDFRKREVKVIDLAP